MLGQYHNALISANTIDQITHLGSENEPIMIYKNIYR